MGRVMNVVTYSPLEDNVLQQANHELALEVVDARGLSSTEPLPEVPTPTATHSDNSAMLLVPAEAMSKDESVVENEEEDGYDMCNLCTSPHDDDYVLVDLEPIPNSQHTSSPSLEKKQEAPKS
ncbi:unnamed protein product [Rhizoctonia solani]|uniref:Uncharacterized protein n=1 Tax=Rhizoctonia solani TaxID=456999 RepID=A0A8H2W7R7_9AGAM|nr:unnamed protein product [Rhizoctonia solani]